MVLAALLLANPKASFDALLFIQEIPDAQAQHVGDPEGRVNAYHEQQQVANATLSPQEVFDLGDPFSVANGFNKIHANEGKKLTPQNGEHSCSLGKMCSLRTW